MDGNPHATLGSLLVDMRDKRFDRGARLDAHDFNAKAKLIAAFELTSIIGGWSSGNLSLDGLNTINLLGRRQFRLRFDLSRKRGLQTHFEREERNVLIIQRGKFD